MVAYNHAYGVVAGALGHSRRDPIDDFSHYDHENLLVDTPAGMYRCAIDVDSKMTNDGMEWRVT